MSERAIRLDGTAKRAIEFSRNRLYVTSLVFGACFLVMAGRVIDLGLSGVHVADGSSGGAIEVFDGKRANIVDRNGIVLATDLVAASLFANPRKILDPAAAAKKLAGIFPNLSRGYLEATLSDPTPFVWIKRKLTPGQQHAVNRLGIPGLGFEAEIKRVYPQQNLLAHVLGHVDIDNRGRAGIEGRLDGRLTDPAMIDSPLVLSIDSRVQHVLRDELNQAMKKHSASGAAGLILDVQTGEVLAMTSLPDFNANNAAAAMKDPRFVNRATYGVYEMGSTFKTFTLAMALEEGTVALNGGYDASKPIRVARHTISDDHAKARWLSVPEIYMYSSNIATAKMALDAGPELQQSFLKRLHLLEAADIELLEIGTPHYPEKWRKINLVTVAYGHGIAVSALQLASAVAAVSGDGIYRPPTLVQRRPDYEIAGERVISEATSRKVQALMRLVVERGTGRGADAKGYLVGGKTGTAEKIKNGRYSKTALLSSFVGVFPSDNPRYIVFAMLDEPKGTADTYGIASGGWVAAPVVKRTVLRAAPMLGVKPSDAQTHPMTEELLKLLRPEVRS